MYLDNAATTPLTEEVKNYIISSLDVFGNPSSQHSKGFLANRIIHEAKEKVSSFIGCKKENVIFTSSGSANNTLAIKGFYNGNDNAKILYSPICHKSVILAAESCEDSYKIRVDSNGRIDLEHLDNLLASEVNKKILIVVDHANSEIGTIQDVAKIIDIAHNYGAYVYLDCTGSIPYIPINAKKLKVDMIGFSGHKLGALKGVGVFYKKKEIQLSPLIYGSQMEGLFGGTENILGISSLSAALNRYPEYYDEIEPYKIHFLYDKIKDGIPDCFLIGSSTFRLPYNLNICIPNVLGEVIVGILDEQYDIQCSVGSACNNYSSSPSHVLTAIGVDNPRECMRISLCGTESYSEILSVAGKIVDSVKLIRGNKVI